MTRKEILETAEKIVNGEREEQYGTPENNFKTIAKFWEAYLNAQCIGQIEIELHDVAAMLALLKIARIAGGQAKDDNWVDLAGYAACGGELQPGTDDPEKLLMRHDLNDELTEGASTSATTATQAARDTWPVDPMMNRKMVEKMQQDLNDELTKTAFKTKEEADQYIEDMVTRWFNSWKGR